MRAARTQSYLISAWNRVVVVPGGGALPEGGRVGCDVLRTSVHLWPLFPLPGEPEWVEYPWVGVQGLIHRYGLRRNADCRMRWDSETRGQCERLVNHSFKSDCNRQQSKSVTLFVFHSGTRVALTQ